MDVSNSLTLPLRWDRDTTICFRITHFLESGPNIFNSRPELFKILEESVAGVFVIRLINDAMFSIIDGDKPRVPLTTSLGRRSRKFLQTRNRSFDNQQFLLPNFSKGQYERWSAISSLEEC